MIVPADFAISLLESARQSVRETEEFGSPEAIMVAHLQLDMLTLGYDAVMRKIKAGHPYGTVGCQLGSE